MPTSSAACARRGAVCQRGVRLNGGLELDPRLAALRKRVCVLGLNLRRKARGKT